MKKILSVIVSVIVSVGMNAQVVKVYENGSLSATYTNTSTNTVKVVFEEAPKIGTGTAKAKLDGTNEVDVTWVQLWSGGPKFATINVGQTVTDYSTITTATYSLANVGGLYTWGGTNNFNVSSSFPADDHNTGSAVLTGNNDTATKLWGSAWRMPTQEELNSLINSTNCTWTWCDGETGDGHKQYVSGCNLVGYKVSGKTGTVYANNCVFLPAVGYYNGSSLIQQGSRGGYWSSTPAGGSYAYRLSFNSDSPNMYSNYLFTGYSVRAVLKE